MENKKSKKILLIAKIIIALLLAFNIVFVFYFSSGHDLFDRVAITFGGVVALLVFAFIPSGILYLLLKRKYKDYFLVFLFVFLILMTVFSTIGRLYRGGIISELSLIGKDVNQNNSNRFEQTVKNFKLDSALQLAREECIKSYDETYQLYSVPDGLIKLMVEQCGRVGKFDYVPGDTILTCNNGLIGFEDKSFYVNACVDRKIKRIFPIETLKSILDDD